MAVNPPNPGATGLYGQSLSLLTDLYQLTMAYGYWKLGRADQQSVFHLTFRKHPFAGGYSLACGLHAVIDYLRGFRFDPSDLEYLATLTGNDGKPLFERGYLDFLARMEFACDVDAIPEGTAVFPHEPLVRVTGPILQAQIIETPLLNLVNFQTLIATKAARICQATRGEPVLEFGLRRAQGIDGGLSASRSAYVGGADATSNVLAGKVFGIPVKGTHAHSWVMSFDDELGAFEGYAGALPNNCVFLVDTYDTLEGVRNAVRVGRQLRERGHEMVGVRLDSGDLAYLSIEARKILDAGGFPDAKILASNDLDEHIIASLKEQGAKVAVWGVGTKLATAYDQPALGGVYKLAAIKEGGAWKHKVKLSEQAAKTSNPGVLNVRRFTAGGEFAGDAIYDEDMGPRSDGHTTIVDPLDPTRRKRFDDSAAHEDLLVPVFRGGKLVYDVPPLDAVRSRAQQQLAAFHPGVRRFLNPHQYPVGLEHRLHDLKTQLILQARGHG
ncbi:MAG TPA: nicotinate phosphoribosyltransferase [Humisphaera sp.]